MNEPPLSRSRTALQTQFAGRFARFPQNNTAPGMRSGMRLGFLAISLYLVAEGFMWLWFHPHLVGMRVHELISVGAPASDVERVFHVLTYKYPAFAYCGNDAPPDVSRIAISENARVPLLPLPLSVVTTTIFCFDASDRLVGIKTERWFDDL